MATFKDEFLYNFNNLEGVTIAERHKNFFKLLQKIAPLLKHNTEDLDFISTSLKASSLLEDVFKVHFFIYFQRTSELFQLLKEGNSIVVSKLAKQDWFFKEAFNSVLADQLVNEILPCMSYSVRMKVLRKLCRYTTCEKFEQIFDALVTRYGIYLASQFITGCSSEKVRQILINHHHIRLTSTQLRILYGKDPGLIEFYFINSRHSIRERCYKNLVKFIFHKDRNYFDYLKQKAIIYEYIKLGRRASKKFVTVNKDAVIRDLSNFKYLDIKAVIRKIGKDSVKLFTNSLPYTLPTTPYELRIFGLINRFPNKYRYSLYFKAFQSHYNIKFEDHPKLIDETLLKIIPENSERAMLAKVKVDRGCDDYLKYLLISDSIPLIKEKINLTSDIHERAKLISYLVETCHINDDISALSSVLKYFCFRHKNDDLKVHLSFIQNIEKLFGFEKFNEEMWTSMNELLMIHMLKFDKSDATYEKIQSLPLLSFNLGISVHQKLSYLEFLFKKGEQIDILLREYFTTNSEYPMYGKYKKSFEKYFLLFVINHISKQSDEQEDLDFNTTLISEIDKWNKRYKDDQLSFYDFPALLYTFNYVIRNYSCDGISIPVCLLREFRDKIFTTQQNSYRKEYLQMYWQQQNNSVNFKDIKWFLKYDPLVIVENFETVFDMLSLSFSKCNRSIWYVIKKYRHLQLDERSVDKCLTKLKEDDPKVMKAKYVPCLSVLMKPSDYVVLADSYKPENKKLDLTNQKEVTLYQLQCAIATAFKNTESYEVLSSVLNYCAGDYFKYAMPSLYSLLYRTPENMLPQYLNYLSTKAVSVRKHALFLTRELSTSANLENMLRLLNEQEGDLSLQKHMFSATVQYFVKNPTDSVFELVKLNMLFVGKADDESLSSIVSHLISIPQKYQTAYILHAWEHLEKTIEIWHRLKPLKHGLLHHVNEKIAKEIPLEWGFGVIDQHFLTENDRDLKMSGFLFDFVTVREERDAILEKIFTLLDRCKKCYFVLDVVDRVDKFLHSWYSNIMKAQSTDLKYLKPFVNYFEAKVTPVEKFSDYVKVFFLKIKVEYSLSLPVDELAAKVLSCVEEVNLNFGPHVTYLFAKEMDSNLSYFVVKNSVTKFDIYYSMITQRPIPLVAILLSYVVSKRYEYFESSSTFYKIIREMKRIEDDGVQVILRDKFKGDCIDLL